MVLHAAYNRWHADGSNNTGYMMAQRVAASAAKTGLGAPALRYAT